MTGAGYDANTWRLLRTLSGRTATPDDIEQGRAVYALGDTRNARTLPVELPQPVIWWSDEGEVAAVAVQAEAHDTEEHQTLEVLGLVLPDGETAVALLEDVDMVDDTDPVWLELLEEWYDEDEYEGDGE
jgi:hypothetical protein